MLRYMKVLAALGIGLASLQHPVTTMDIAPEPDAAKRPL
jgi:hypothetical protein